MAGLAFVVRDTHVLHGTAFTCRLAARTQSRTQIHHALGVAWHIAFLARQRVLGNLPKRFFMGGHRQIVSKAM